MRIRVPGITALTVLGFVLFGSSTQANAADGVARVSHVTAHPQYTAAPESPYYVATGYRNHNYARQPPNPSYWTFMPLPFHGCCDYCGDANCPGKKGLWTFPFVRWVLDPDYYTVAPDYGWSPPARVPVRRQNVTYQNYGPNAWGGAGAGDSNAGAAGQGQPQRRPIIATPTDTTQLGYYYQHVPTWQPKNILPVAPHPRHWHTRPSQLDQNSSYVRWMRLQNAWVPIQQIPGS
jgi:hypothetical protein